MARVIEPSRLARWRRAALRRVTRMGSWASVARLAPRPRLPMGISAVVRVRNEEDTITESLESLLGHVDEFVVADASDDATPDLVARFAKRHGAPVQHLRFGGARGAAATRFGTTASYASEGEQALRACRYRYALRWDGDFVARDGSDGFAAFRRRVLALDPRRHWIVSYPHVLLMGDLAHQRPDRQLHTEHWLVTVSDGLHWVDRGRFEAFQIPWYYGRALWPVPYSFHLADAKPNRRLWLRSLWTDWREAADFARSPTLEAYARAQAAAQGLTPDEAERRFLATYVGRLKPYDARRWGALPPGAAGLAARLPYRVDDSRGTRRDAPSETGRHVASSRRGKGGRRQ